MLPIAVVDDDVAIRDLMCDVLTEEGYWPSLFEGAEGVHQGIRAVSPVVIILDLHLGTPDAGWALLNDISTDPLLERAALIICSGDHTGLDTHVGALQGRPFAVLPKPFDLDDLTALLQRLIPRTTPEHGPSDTSGPDGRH